MLHPETHFKKRRREELHYVNECAVPGVEIGKGSTDVTLNFAEPSIWRVAQDNLIYQLSKDRKILL